MTAASKASGTNWLEVADRLGPVFAQRIEQLDDTDSFVA